MSGEAGDEALVFTTKGCWSWVSGIGAVAIGAGVIWFALQRPGEENAWVPWVVGLAFAAVGLFELLSRSRVIFDPTTRRWSDRWGALFFEFKTEGTFEQLRRVRVEASERRHGQFSYYVWVHGDPDVRILADLTMIPSEADETARRLREMLDLDEDR
jgi:hypothetical protein